MTLSRARPKGGPARLLRVNGGRQRCPLVYSEPPRARWDPELFLPPFSIVLRFPFLATTNGVRVKHECCWRWRGRVFVHGPGMERLKACPGRQTERGWWWREKQRDVRMTNWAQGSRCICEREVILLRKKDIFDIYLMNSWAQMVWNTILLREKI